MNWKFWKGRETLDELNERVAIAQMQKLAAEQKLRTVYARTPAAMTELEQGRANMQRLMVLAGLDPNNDLWQTVLAYADEHERNEGAIALAPGLTDGDRQYNAGRAASARDFASALRDLWVKAQQEARKVKGG